MNVSYTLRNGVAVILAATLIMPVTWAQQPTDSTSTKRSRIERKPSAPKNGGASKKRSAVVVDAATLAAAQAESKARADALVAAQALANKTNPFNRTMRPIDSYNLPPSEDGIHDPGIESVNSLNAPLDAYTDFPRNKAGNRVDWVATLAANKISPRWDRTDVNAERMVMDMDIVRVPKGSMPNVVFPHKQHTEWLACANCHPGIFVPQKGANQISMSMILGGQKCGICHGKVAFPPSECTKCHSQKKDVSQ